MLLERLAQPQPLWMRRERPLTPIFLVRSPLHLLRGPHLTNSLGFPQNTLPKHHGTWIPEDPRCLTNVDLNMTTLPTNSTTGTTEEPLPAQPRRNTEKAHARTVAR